MTKKHGFILFALTFLCGFGFAVLCGAVIDFLDLAVTPSEHLVRQWGLFEGDDGKLTIPLLDNGFLIEIDREPENRSLKSIDVMKKDVGGIFEYKAIGEYGVPWAQYSGVGGDIGEGTFWVDLDGNGEFDERIRLKKGMHILVADKWTRATMKGRMASTVDGMFEFDIQTGKWRKVSVGQNK